MSYLLDTHSLIWSVLTPAKLSLKTKAILRDAEQEVLVSAVSFWEISLKYALGKLKLEGLSPEDLVGAATDIGFRIIELDAKATSTFHQLSAIYHRDPFDRMLIWQAIQSEYTLISKDELVQKYQSEGLKVLW